MNSECFVRQSATQKILEYVSRFCSECYREFGEGDAICYDLQHYRYLCVECADKLAKQMDERCEIVEEERGGLF